MKQGRTSRTAEIAAASRALHHLYAPPAIFEDPFALDFTNPLWRRIVVTKPLREVVFDYLVPDQVLSSAERPIVEKLKRFTARRGEPLIGEFHPDELEGMLASVGLDLIENLSGTEQEKRYFAGRNDGLRPATAELD